jgi:transcriptional regulator with XRE-family HTH domain
MNLRDAREVAGISQFALAQRSGIPRMRLSLAECGEIQLRPAEIDAIRSVVRAEIEQRTAKLTNALSIMGTAGVNA